MSTQVFPTLPGLAYPVTRTAMWDSDVQTAISGKENRLAYWTYPKYQWAVSFGVLRSAAALAEFQALMGFFNARQGQLDTFLYQDPDDYSVVAQTIGTGDGSTKLFQAVKSLGSFIEPVLALNAFTGVYLNGVLQTPSSAWNYTTWGNTYGFGGGSSTNGPGVINFQTAPAAGVAITATFTYYYPCRFIVDKLDFELAYNQLYRVKKLTWQSVKN